MDELTWEFLQLPLKNQSRCSPYPQMVRFHEARGVDVYLYIERLTKCIHTEEWKEIVESHSKTQNNEWKDLAMQCNPNLLHAAFCSLGALWYQMGTWITKLFSNVVCFIH